MDDLYDQIPKAERRLFVSLWREELFAYAHNLLWSGELEHMLMSKIDKSLQRLRSI